MSNDTEYAVEHELTLVQRYLTLFTAIKNLEFDKETDALAQDALWASVFEDPRLSSEDRLEICAAQLRT